MKKLNLILILVLSISTEALSQNINKHYDSTLAISLGADDFGMKKYMLVLLKTGSNLDIEKSRKDSLFSGHLKNIGHLASINKLIIAGPMGKNDLNYRGIFILNVQTIEEAKTLLKSDPAIAENLLEPIIVTWYGSAAISEYLKTHDKIWKKNP